MPDESSQMSFMYHHLLKTKEEIALNAFELAQRLEARAMTAHSLQGLPKFSDPSVLYNMAYNVYQSIAECPEYNLIIRGKAAFQLWCLAQENKVLFQIMPTENKEEKLNSFLEWAAKCGCIEAQITLQEKNYQRNSDETLNTLQKKFKM